MSRDSSDIEVRALRAFRAQLPDSCIENEESQDKQHLDYTLHLREGGEPSGIQFAVQVKGQSRPTKGRRTSKSFKREHLEYWIERSRLPVFIVIVDVSKGIAYYRSAREWARFFGGRWKGQATTTVHIPTHNRVANHTQFIQAIVDADLEIQRSAGQWAIDRYSNIDDRFLYEIRNKPGGDQEITIQAREPVQVQVVAKGHGAIRRLVEMWKTGQPQEFRHGELTFDGGPLFEHMQSETGGQPFRLQTVAERDCHIAFIVEKPDGNQLRVLEGLRGKIHAGSECVEYSTELRGGPVRVHGNLRLDEQRGFRGEFHLDVDVPAWIGQKLPHLHNVEALSAFTNALRDAMAMSLHFTIDGISIEPPIPLQMELVEALYDRLTRSIDLIVGMCEVADRLQITPRFPRPSDLSDADFEQLGLLVDVCRSEVVSVSIGSIEAEMTFTLREGIVLPERDELMAGRFLWNEAIPAELFGEVSDRLHLVRQLGPFAVVDCPDLESMELGAQIRVQLRGMPDAKAVYRLSAPDQIRLRAWFSRVAEDPTTQARSDSDHSPRDL